MKRNFLFALFVTIAGSACAREQAATIVEAGFDYSLVQTTSTSGGNQLTSNGGASGFKASGEKTVWYKLLKREFKELAFGGASSFTIRRRGLYTGSMSVEPVGVITR
jgi:hypothetical protein